MLIWLLLVPQNYFVSEELPNPLGMGGEFSFQLFLGEFSPVPIKHVMLLVIVNQVVICKI